MKLVECWLVQDAPSISVTSILKMIMLFHQYNFSFACSKMECVVYFSSYLKLSFFIEPYVRHQLNAIKCSCFLSSETTVLGTNIFNWASL